MNRRIVAGLLFGSALILAGCIQPPPPRQYRRRWPR